VDALSPGQAAASVQWCELSVQDNGIGFDEKYLDRIFAVFQRLHGRQEYEGTGIGLAVCRRIADRHGGTITARSTPGQGACFTVKLPFRQEQTSEGRS
jgi:signal transduction histidine kinase